VTEQDVINEEMYEEEDDDLPLHYRRLTAHLQTGSADFNRRLSAYLTNHVAMRSALEQTIHQSYAQQFPNAPQYAHNQPFFPSPLLAHQQQQLMQQQQQQIFRQQPYPSPQPPQSFQLGGQARSASIATPQHHAATIGSASPTVPCDDARRMSVPSGSIKSETPDSANPATPASTVSGTPQIRPAVPQFSPAPLPMSQPFLPTYNMGAFSNDFGGVFSSALPINSQMFLGNTLDMSDPMSSMLMAGSQNFPQFNFNSSLPLAQDMNLNKAGGPQVYPTSEGLNSTLSAAEVVDPRDLTMSPEYAGQMSFFDASFGESTGQSLSSTPNAVDNWSSFINDDSWDNFPSGSQ